MKKHLLLILFGASCVRCACSQGSLLFNNVYFQTRPGSAPVTISTIPGMSNPANGVAGAYVGSNYTASLFFVEGTVDSQAIFDSLGPVWAADAPFYGATGFVPDHGPDVDGAGFFDGGKVILNASSVARVTIQVKAWYNGGGLFNSYSQALAVGQNTGQSILVPIQLGFPPDPAPTLDGLQPFTVGIPEPSTFLLALLGGAALVLFRRFK